MGLSELKINHIYYLPGLGNVIYNGICSNDKSIKLIPITNPGFIVYIDKLAANTIRAALDKPKKIDAEWLHDNDLLHVGDDLAFINQHGTIFGKVKYLYNKRCDLTVRGLTREVHLKHLFTYEAIIGNLQARACLIAALQGKDSLDTQHKIPESAAC